MQQCADGPDRMKWCNCTPNEGFTTKVSDDGDISTFDEAINTVQLSIILVPV